ncbi:MAG: DUF4352 domain-containing protein [Bacteroidota bacterium]
MEQQKKKTSWGKKILIGIGVLFIIGVIGSQLEDNEQVGQKVNEPANNQEEKKPSNEPKVEYQKIGDQIEVGDFSYLVNGIQFKKSIGDEMYNQVADGIYLIIDLTFRNNDTEQHKLDNSFFKLTDETGTEFLSSTDGESALEMTGKSTLFLKECNPKIQKRGFLVFEVAEKKIYDLHLSGGFWSGKTAVVKLSNN